MRSLPLLALAILAAPVAARDADAQRHLHSGQASHAVEVSSGLDYEEGEYGTGQKVRRLLVPNTVRVGVGRLEINASLPYTRIDGPGNVVAGGGLLGLPIIVDPTRPSTRVRRDGIGDLSVGVAYQIPNRIVDLKVSGEVKLPTASKNSWYRRDGLRHQRPSVEDSRSRYSVCRHRLYSARRSDRLRAPQQRFADWRGCRFSRDEDAWVRFVQPGQ